MAVAALASSHAVKSLDPIDKVTIETLAEYPKAQEILRHGWTTKKFTPFDPVSKRITAEVERDGKAYIAAKGAPNAILKLCNSPDHDAKPYRQKTYEFAKRGFRSLGVAINEDGQWKLLGLLSLSDPPRDDTAATINEARTLGINVKMLTGDAVAIAVEVCKQLGMGSKVYDSQKLIAGGMTGSDIHDFVEAADGFGEVFPEHKYQVVEMLQQRGHLTAMVRSVSSIDEPSDLADSSLRLATVSTMLHLFPRPTVVSPSRVPLMPLALPPTSSSWTRVSAPSSPRSRYPARSSTA